MNRRIIHIVIAIVVLMSSQTTLRAQRMAVNTNLFEDLILNPNLGIDIVIFDKQTISFDLTYAPFKLTQQYHNQNMSFKAGYKYWFNQAFYAHYIGADVVAMSTDFQVGPFGMRYECLGLGLSYGYSFIINKQLNIVPHIGAGMSCGYRYEGRDQMLDPLRGEKAVPTFAAIPIITRFGVTLQYVIK